MDLTSIVTTFLTACVPALISYFVSRNKNKSDIVLLRTQYQAEIEKIKLTHDSEIEKLKLTFAHEDKRPINQELAKIAPQLFSMILKEKGIDYLVELGHQSSQKKH